MKTRIFLLLSLILCLTACQTTPPIEQMPYPETSEWPPVEVEMDYAATFSLNHMWSEADYVVIGYYLNEAPDSVNIMRKASNPEEEDADYYLESLVYSFQVVSVLKGDLEETVIPLGLYHGQKYLDATYPEDTFLQPDAESYKIMFLWYNSINDYYYPWNRLWWLSTDMTQSAVADEDWTQMTFTPEGSLLDEMILYLDMEPDGAVASSAPRTGYTGAELLNLAQTQTDEQTE